MTKIIIGYDKNQTILSAVVPQYSSNEDLGNDVLDMLRSGLTINTVEIPKCIIGDKFDWAYTKIVNL
jgi:hypothetical protein